MSEVARYHGIAPTPFPGLKLGLVADGLALVAVDFVWDDAFPVLQPVAPTNAPAIECALSHLAEFFAGRPITRVVSVKPAGTAFQRRVWQAMQEIPAGQTRRYGELAQALNSSARAVGGACRANPIPFLIPCHRVVATAGLGGFAGAHEGRLVDLKRWLLAHEQGN